MIKTKNFECEYADISEETLKVWLKQEGDDAERLCNRCWEHFIAIGEKAPCEDVEDP